MEFGTLFLQISFIIVFLNIDYAIGFLNDNDERKCHYTRVKKLLKIRCYDLNLKEVPQNLKTSVEILDLSFNRIKRLRANSFEKYTNIKYLVLYENMIQNVEPGTFKHLTSVEEIDLSNNGLLAIPSEIFDMPSLRNLYMDSNELTQIDVELQSLKTPIRAPLEYLNLADCMLMDVPDFGILPKLRHINISRNPLLELKLNKFSNMCNLATIDLTHTSIDDCTCYNANQLFGSTNVNLKFVPICSSDLDESSCPNSVNQTSYSEDYQRCKRTELRADVQRKWFIVGVCISAAIVALLLLSWCGHQMCFRRKKNERANNRNKRNIIIKPKNATANLKNEDSLLVSLEDEQKR